MLKFASICLFAVLAVVSAEPGLVGPLAYSAPVAPVAYATAPAVVGHATYVAPYASSFNAHNVAHSASFPAAPVVAAAPVVRAVAPVVAAAPVVRAVAPVVHAAAPAVAAGAPAVKDPVVPGAYAATPVVHAKPVAGPLLK